MEKAEVATLFFLTKSRFEKARRLKLFVCLGLLFILSRAMVFAQAIDWPTLGFTQVVTNIFTEPTCITHAGDGSQRLFVLSQPGKIWIIQNSNVLAQPFLDISAEVASPNAEQGLLGLAFPPGFSTNNHFYADYTRQPDGAIVVSRFFLTPTNPNVANTNSEQVILVIQKPFATPGVSFNSNYSNHNAGQLAFGPDGYLYIGVGDGGSENDPLNNGQNKTNLLGKILRIDVESGVLPYAIPPSNPYATNTNYDPRFWAYGLRNPWRFSFDDQTGDLYIGDVGENRYEEIDFQPADSPGGQNYGWRIMEGDSNFIVPSGFTNFASLTLPVTTYSHASLPYFGEAAVIGGYVYRGPNQPRMNGMYFYGDFIAGWIWGLMRSGTNWQSQILFSPGYSGFPNPYNISTFGEDDQGNLYVSSYYNGTINKIQDTLQTWTPVFGVTNVANSNTVVVTCLTTNAQIHYTTNGIVPMLSDPFVYSGESIPVYTGVTNMLRAFRSDLSPSGVATAVFTEQVGTPIFNPSGGSIVSNSIVTISTVTPGAVIYYTTDGTTPTTSSSPYTSPLILNGNTTLKALGVASGYSNSIVASTSYSAAQVATPVFSPSSGPITNDTPIAITCSTPGSVIYCTLDGTTPTTNSAIYTGPIMIQGGTTVNAFATAYQYLNSGTRSTFYQLVQTATPVFNPASGPITNNTSITITCSTPGSVIYYTLDGTTPTTNSSIYTGPIMIQGGTTVSAFAIANQYLNSAVQSVFFQLVQTATPMFNPSSGPVTNGTSIAISCATPGSTIFYTSDGTIPTTNSAVYTDPIMINGATTLNAFAVANQFLNSSVQSVTYQIAQTAMPAFNPPNGPIAQGTTVSISCATPGSTIFYTVNGTTASTNSAAYSAPLTIETDTTVSAMATAPAELNSSVQNVYYTLFQAATPIFNPSGGPLTNDALISISCASSNATVRYTVDGSNPSATNGFTYLSPLTLTNPMTLTAVAYRSDLDPSYLESASYTLYDIENTVVTTLAGNPSAGFSNGFGAAASFSSPEGICIDKSGNLYVADTGNNVVREISFTGQVTTFAGTGVAGSQLGTTTNSQFSSPTSVAVDSSSNLYVVDAKNYRICKISPGGSLATFYSMSAYPYLKPPLWQSATDPFGNLDVGCALAVEQINSSGSGNTLAGPESNVPSECEYGWCSSVGVGVDSSANVYATTAKVIYKIAPNGTTVLYAGQPSAANAPPPVYTDGSRLLSTLESPQDATVDQYTNVFVSDTTRVRKIRFDGWVSTMAGTGNSGYLDGRGYIAQFNGADGLCVDTNGNIYVADSGNNSIREISPDTAGIGIADWWQLKYFGYVGVNPNADPNNNGMTLYEDFWAGLNPTNPASVFKVVNTAVTNGNFQVSWTSVLGKNYTVQWSSDLKSWNTLSGPISGNGSVVSYTDSTPSLQISPRFYRIVVSF